jgi:hypothetical protein
MKKLLSIGVMLAAVVTHAAVLYPGSGTANMAEYAKLASTNLFTGGSNYMSGNFAVGGTIYGNAGGLVQIPGGQLVSYSVGSNALEQQFLEYLLTNNLGSVEGTNATHLIGISGTLFALWDGTVSNSAAVGGLTADDLAVRGDDNTFTGTVNTFNGRVDVGSLTLPLDLVAVGETTSNTIVRGDSYSTTFAFPGGGDGLMFVTDPGTPTKTVPFAIKDGAQTIHPHGIIASNVVEVRGGYSFKGLGSLLGKPVGTYSATWSGSTNFATEGALYAKIESLTVGGGGGNQTPWESDIDANGFWLTNTLGIKGGTVEIQHTNLVLGMHFTDDALNLGENVIAGFDNIFYGGANVTIIGNSHEVGVVGIGDVRYATAIGYNTTNLGNSSVTIGYQTYAGDSYASALGWRTRALHEGAFVAGVDVESQGNYTATFGSPGGTYLIGPTYLNGESLIVGSGNSLSAVSKSFIASSDKTLQELTNAVVADRYVLAPTDGSVLRSVVSTNANTVWIDAAAGDDSTGDIGSAALSYRTFDAAWADYGTRTNTTFHFLGGTYLVGTNYVVLTDQKFVSNEGALLVLTNQPTDAHVGKVRIFLGHFQASNMIARGLTVDVDGDVSWGTDSSIAVFDFPVQGSRLENVKVTGMKSTGSQESFALVAQNIVGCTVSGLVDGNGGYTAILVVSGGSAYGNRINMAGAYLNSDYLNGLTPYGDHIVIGPDNIVSGALAGTYIDTPDTDGVIDDVRIHDNAFYNMSRNGAGLWIRPNASGYTFRNIVFENNSVAGQGDSWTDWGVILQSTNTGGITANLTNVTVRHNDFFNLGGMGGIVAAERVTNAWIYGNIKMGATWTNDLMLTACDGIIRRENNSTNDAYYTSSTNRLVANGLTLTGSLDLGTNTLTAATLQFTNVQASWTTKTADSQDTNFVVSVSDSSRVRINASTNVFLTLTDLAEGWEGTVKVRAIGAARSVTFPTNYVWLSTNGFTISDTNYTFSLPEGKMFSVGYECDGGDMTNAILGGVIQP